MTWNDAALAMAQAIITLGVRIKKLEKDASYDYDKDMEQRCIEAYDAGDSRPLKEVIEKLRTEITASFERTTNSIQKEMAANKKAAPYDFVLYVLQQYPLPNQLDNDKRNVLTPTQVKAAFAQSSAAIELFDDAGITLPIKKISSRLLAAYGAPVLFSSLGISPGAEAIAKLLKSIGF